MLTLGAARKISAPKTSGADRKISNQWNYVLLITLRILINFPKNPKKSY